MGGDWRTNALTQIRWGLWYIGSSYGSPCNALAHSNAYRYY
jgi:peptidoglycan DL-endopeptidase CwlO